MSRVELSASARSAMGDRGFAGCGVPDGSAALPASERVGVRDVLALRAGEDVSGATRTQSVWLH